jgi:rhodanese-related sulfurtransferase
VVDYTVVVRRNSNELLAAAVGSTRHSRTLSAACTAPAGREDRLILICHEGYSSSLAAVRLHELGYVNTTDVIGGFVAWRAAGLPIESEQQVEELQDARDE